MKTLSIMPFAVAGLVLAASAEPLSWAPPALENPVTLDLGKETSWRNFKLDKTKDYIVLMPTNRPWVGELNLYGGHNVVLIGGEVRIPDEAEDPSFGERNEEGKLRKSRRAVYIQGQTGTLHIEGLLISGAGLHEGFNIAEREPGCVVQLQNIRCETVHGSFSKNHADVIQSWAGPAELRIDGLTAFTDYQGFFLLPNQHFALDKGGFLPTKWDFRRINLVGTELSAYLLWCPDNPGFPIEVANVWVKPASKKKGDRDAFLWPKPKAKGDTMWEKVKEGLPPDGDFVPEGAAGLGYVSPGYADAP
jgi:hypothetical protein